VKVFSIVIIVPGQEVTANLMCENCGVAVASWTGFVGTVHVPMDDATGDMHDHICEE
jgi:hypothetical protein